MTGRIFKDCVYTENWAGWLPQHCDQNSYLFRIPLLTFVSAPFSCGARDQTWALGILSTHSNPKLQPPAHPSYCHRASQLHSVLRTLDVMFPFSKLLLPFLFITDSSAPLKNIIHLIFILFSSF